MTQIHDVVEVRPRGGHRLALRFSDGLQGVVDLDEHMKFDGVFEPFADPARFGDVYISLGTIAWSDQADIDPVLLYTWAKHGSSGIASTGEDPAPYAN